MSNCAEPRPMNHDAMYIRLLENVRAHPRVLTDTELEMILDAFYWHATFYHDVMYDRGWRFDDMSQTYTPPDRS